MVNLGVQPDGNIEPPFKTGILLVIPGMPVELWQSGEKGEALL